MCDDQKNCCCSTDKSKSESASCPSSLKAQVAKALETIRPMLQADGGDVELVDVDDQGTVQVRLKGACGCCPMAQQTLKMGIETRLKEQLPDIKEVVSV